VAKLPKQAASVLFRCVNPVNPVNPVIKQGKENKKTN
jgi:hypothetical protein